MNPPGSFLYYPEKNQKENEKKIIHSIIEMNNYCHGKNVTLSADWTELQCDKILEASWDPKEVGNTERESILQSSIKSMTSSQCAQITCIRTCAKRKFCCSYEYPLEICDWILSHVFVNKITRNINDDHNTCHSCSENWSRYIRSNKQPIDRSTTWWKGADTMIDDYNKHVGLFLSQSK